MKINECSVIDKEALQLTIKMLELSKLSDMQTKIDTNNVNIAIKTLEEIIKNSKPLEPIVRDFHNYGQFAKMELLATGKINIHSVDQYIKQTEI